MQNRAVTVKENSFKGYGHRNGCCKLDDQQCFLHKKLANFYKCSEETKLNLPGLLSDGLFSLLLANMVIFCSFNLFCSFSSL